MLPPGIVETHAHLSQRVVDLLRGLRGCLGPFSARLQGGLPVLCLSKLYIYIYRAGLSTHGFSMGRIICVCLNIMYTPAAILMDKSGHFLGIGQNHK